MSSKRRVYGSIGDSSAPRIGYDKAAEVAKRSLKEEKTLREVVLEMELMTAEDLDTLLDFDAMTRPGVG